MKTIRETLAVGLVKMGWEQVSSGHYWEFWKEGRTGEAKEWKIFLGPNGAMRWGKVKSQSRSLGDPSRQTSYYQQVLELGKLEAGKEGVGLAGFYGLSEDETGGR